MASTDTVRNVPISDVRDRAGADTRKLDLAHVVELAESIGSLGLLEPLVVDAHLRLLGGLHRRHGCLLLAIDDAEQRRAAFLKLADDPRARGTKVLTERIAGVDRVEALAEQIASLDRAGYLARHEGGQVPVRVVPIDSARAKDEALRIEVAENEKRRDYSKVEILALADRLRAQGHTDRPGRPRNGERALRPALAAIIGKSGRHLRALLNGEGKAKGRAQAKAGSTRRKGGRTVTSWSGAIERLRAAVASCRSAAKGQKGARARRLGTLLARVERELKAV